MLIVFFVFCCHNRFQLDKRGLQSNIGSGRVTRAMASVIKGQCLVMIDGRVYRTSQSQLAGGHTTPGRVKGSRCKSQMYLL